MKKFHFCFLPFLLLLSLSLFFQAAITRNHLIRLTSGRTRPNRNSFSFLQFLDLDKIYLEFQIPNFLQHIFIHFWQNEKKNVQDDTKTFHIFFQFYKIVF